MTPPDLPALSPAQAEVALAGYQVLRPALEQAVPLTRLAREAGVPLRTAQRWVAAYRRHGLAGLARRPRADRSQARGIPERLRHCIEGLALQRPLRSLAAIQRPATRTRSGRPITPCCRSICVGSMARPFSPGSR